MRQRLFTILAALSLVLCFALGVLWVRSYWTAEMFRLGVSRDEPPNISFWRLKIVTGRGGVQVWIGHSTIDKTNPTMLGDLRHFKMPLRYPYEAYIEPPPASFAGTQFFQSLPPSGERYVGMTAPLPLFCALFLVLPAISIFQCRRARRLRNRAFNNQCIACGYDLRASPERCPECGKPVDPAPLKIDH